MRLMALLILCAATCAADVTPNVQWDVETGRFVPVPYTLAIRRGESANLQPRFLSYNSAMVLTGATVQLRYWYTGQSGYYAATGSLHATTGRVHIAWTDALCPASNALNYEVRATVGTQVLARAYGPLTLLAGSTGSGTNATIWDEINWTTTDQIGGTAVMSNLFGSGATWTGSNWTFGAATVSTNGLADTNYVNAAVSGKVDVVSLGTAAYSNAGAFYPAGNPSNYVGASVTNGFVDATITNGLGGVSANTVTNTLDLAISPSLTGAVSKANSAVLTNASALALGFNAVADGIQGAIAFGKNVTASGSLGSFAVGNGSYSEGIGSIAMGNYATINAANYAFVWSGQDGYYLSHGDGSFSIDPISGLNGFYIGETSLGTTLGGYVQTNGSGAALTGITAGQVGAVSNTTAGIAAAGGQTNGGAILNGQAISNGAVLRTYSRAPVVLSPATATQYISYADGGWQYLAPTGNITLAFSNDWPITEASFANLALYSGAYSVSADYATISSSMWASVTLSTTATNSIIWHRGFGMGKFAPACSTNWGNP